MEEVLGSYNFLSMFFRKIADQQSEVCTDLVKRNKRRMPNKYLNSPACMVGVWGNTSSVLVP